MTADVEGNVDVIAQLARTLVTFADKGATGKPIYRSFCSRCGSPVYGKGDAFPGVVFIKAGTLDDPSDVEPGAHIWCSEKQPWVVIEEGVAQVPGNPQ